MWRRTTTVSSPPGRLRCSGAPSGRTPTAATGPLPGDEYGQADSRDQLVRALRQLPMRMRMRTVVVLRYCHDLVSAMNRYSDSTEAPSSTRIAAGGGTALASMNGDSRPTPAQSDATTLLYDDRGVAIPIDFSRWDLEMARKQTGGGPSGEQ